MLFVDVLMRWLHVSMAMVLVGGAFFQWIVLRPVARNVLESEHQKLREQILEKWRKVVGMGIGLLLLTGFYNYLVASNPGDIWKPYHAVMGVKMLLALGVFFLASALTGRAAVFEGMRRQATTWLCLLIVLSLSVVALSSYLKVQGAKVLRTHPAATQTITTPR